MIKSFSLWLTLLALVIANIHPTLEAADASFSPSEMSCKQPVRGPQGPAGPQGEQGDPGAAGTNGVNAGSNFLYTETDLSFDEGPPLIGVGSTVIFATAALEQNGTALSFTGPSDTITVNEAGWYEVEVVAYGLNVENVGLQLFLNGTAIPPGKTVTNIDLEIDLVTTIIVDKVINCSAGSTLTVEAITASTGTIFALAPLTQISIHVIKLADAPAP